MSQLSVGIVGMPNVGKSTLFNAMLKKQAALVANYPFATIDPNVGVVPVPDDRLEKLADVVAGVHLPGVPQAQHHLAGEIRRPPIVPATVKFVDIAGLVKGASQGEGLGNKFLSHIREVDAMVYVLRDFSDENVVRAGSVNPQSDEEVLEAELMLADLEVAEKILEASKKDVKSPDHELITTTLQSMVVRLKEGKRVAEVGVPERLAGWKKTLPFLTLKPVIRVLNVDENKIDSGQLTMDNAIRISAKMESELAGLTEEEQGEYLKSLGLSEPGLNRLVKKAFDILGLQTFLTAGEKEARAWTIKKETKAPQAAGVIHTDFETHFIKADVINWEEFVADGGWVRARELGHVRLEGREYVMQEGDVVEFKVGV